MGVTNLVTRSEVVVAASSAEVWPLVEDPNDWKLGLKPQHVSGQPGTVGEVRRASYDHEGAEVWLEIETVALAVPHRKVIKIQTSAGGSPSWAAWSLADGDDGTVVTYDVYGQVELADGEADSYVHDNQRRFDEELLRLKALVEGQR